MIADKGKMLCYATKQECKTVISSDKKKCIASCSTENKETTISSDNGEYS